MNAVRHRISISNPASQMRNAKESGRIGQQDWCKFRHEDKAKGEGAGRTGRKKEY